MTADLILFFQTTIKRLQTIVWIVRRNLTIVDPLGISLAGPEEWNVPDVPVRRSMNSGCLFGHPGAPLLVQHLQALRHQEHSQHEQ